MNRSQWPTPDFIQTDRRSRILQAAPRVSEVFEQLYAADSMPGISFAVVVDAEIVFASSVGVRCVGDIDAPNAQTTYRIASMTKSFTAAAVLLLRDRGYLRLDDAVAPYLPEMDVFPKSTTDSADITIRDLLMMIAGWPQDDPWADRQLYRSDASMQLLYAQGMSPSNPPGLSFEYSNLAYMLLGRLISRVSNVASMRFIDDELLGPLGMSSSCWDEGDVAAGSLAPGYRFEDGVLKEEPRLLSGGDVAAFAGLFSTTADLARWVGMFMDAFPARDGAELGPLKRSSLREMQRITSAHRFTRTPRRIHERAEDATSGYGYGLLMRDDGSDWTAGHSGGVPGYGSHMRWLPEHGIGVIALSNVTYAGVGNACIDALQLLTGVSKARRGSSSVVLLGAQDGVNRLLGAWDEDLLEDLFADNFFLDKDQQHWQSELSAVRALVGDLTGDCTALVPQNWLRGHWRVAATRGWIHVWMTLAPTVPPRIQTLRLTPQQFPSGSLTRLAQTVVAQLDEPYELQLTELVADADAIEAMWRGVRAAAARIGTSALGAYIAGDGSTKGRWHVHGVHGDVLLEVVTNSDVKLTDVRFIEI